jgi:uncharacterized protein YerC
MVRALRLCHAYCYEIAAHLGAHYATVSRKLKWIEQGTQLYRQELIRPDVIAEAI